MDRPLHYRAVSLYAEYQPTVRAALTGLALHLGRGVVTMVFLMHKIAQSNLELTCVDSFRLQSFICDSLLSSQFNKWLRDSKSRVLDIFRRMDHDRDGKLTREQFITGILNTSKRDIIFQPSVTYRFNQALSPCTLA